MTRHCPPKDADNRFYSAIQLVKVTGTGRKKRKIDRKKSQSIAIFEPRSCYQDVRRRPDLEFISNKKRPRASHSKTEFSFVHATARKKLGRLLFEQQSLIAWLSMIIYQPIIYQRQTIKRRVHEIFFFFFLLEPDLGNRNVSEEIRVKRRFSVQTKGD